MKLSTSDKESYFTYAVKTRPLLKQTAITPVRVVISCRALALACIPPRQESTELHKTATSVQ